MDNNNTDSVLCQPPLSTRVLLRLILLAVPRILVRLLLHLCIALRDAPGAITDAVDRLDCCLADLAEGETQYDPSMELVEDEWLVDPKTEM